MEVTYKDGPATMDLRNPEPWAEQEVPDYVLKQFFFLAVLEWQGDLDGMGRGVFLYWTPQGKIVDCAVVANCGGFPQAKAPASRALSERPHQVAPFRLGNQIHSVEDFFYWESEFVEKARHFARGGAHLKAKEEKA